MSDAILTNPYVGPRAFEEGEGARFFGRERELEELFHLLLARRLVLLHAPSGAGKSSLVRAALIPRLRDEGFLVRPVIRVGAETVVRGDNRFRAAALLSIDEGLPPHERLTADELATLSLHDYLERHPAPDDAEELLIFDQFEEVLSADPTDRAAKAAFFAELGALLESPRIWALFVLREDYLGAIKPFLLPIPTRLTATYRLDLLDPAQARRAMQGPARAAGRDFTDAAATRLVDDLRQTTVQRPDGGSEAVLGQVIEPVQLQVVCYQLWERTAGDAIAVEDIIAAGDVDAALRGYYAAQVAATAAASGVGEQAIRDWVEAQLITETGLRSQVLREPDDPDGLADTAIQALVRSHLLHAEERRGFIWYELAHDRLIAPARADNAAWFEANLSTLQRQARLWQRADRPDGLLLRGKELREAQQEQRDLELSEDEQAFLIASQEQRRQQQRKRMANRIIFALAIFALGLLYGVWRISLQAIALAQRGSQTVIELRTAEANTQIQLRRSEAQRLAFASQDKL
ncbi:hypothetical protein K2Z83_25345, partial [Oscillochloris sp. ZM17-4]|nr:hypothetical protein [Oscillochloris sp. ZM17-4]